MSEQLVRNSNKPSVMKERIVFILIVFLCVKISINAQHIRADSLRVATYEIAKAQVAKLTHELTLTENQQKQVYTFLLKSINSKTGIDDAFSVELFRILTSRQKSVYLKLQELDKQCAKKVTLLKGAKSTTAQNTLTLDDASVIKDAMIGLNNHPNGSQSANNNYNTFPRICMQAWTYSGATMFKRTVMKLLLGDIQVGSQIVSATLYLYSDPTVTSTSAANGNSQLSGSNAFYIEKITENWDDNTVTWNNQPASTTTDRILVPASTSTTENIQIDMTDMVQQWVNQPDSNYGFKMFLQTEVRYRSRNYGSMEHSNAAIHPKLVVEYNGPSFKFTYDNSGNRKGRNVIILANNLKSAKGSSINIEKPEFEKPVVSSIGEFTITLFPNPTRGDVSLKLNGDSIPERTIYKVFNAGGSMVCNGLLNSSTLQKVPLASQPTGVYILIVQYGDKTKTWKIIKQ